MKKTAGILRAALAVLAAVILVSSCEQATEDPAPEAPATLLTEEFQTYWLSITDADLAGLEGFHMHNPNANVVGMVIDRIVAADTKSLTGAVDVHTFSSAAGESLYWGFGGGTIADGVWSSGEIAAAPEGGSTYVTGFATPAFSGKAYVGIVAKKLSAAVTGDDILFEPIIGSPQADKAKFFKDLFIY